jgi:hypothetical protein
VAQQSIKCVGDSWLQKLNLFTNDIGLNGVPIYTNDLVGARRKLDKR